MSDELSHLILPDIVAAATASQPETVEEARENAAT